MDSSGLREVWVESGVYGENTISHMLIRKAYNKTIRGHKLTYETLWRILCPSYRSRLCKTESNWMKTYWWSLTMLWKSSQPKMKMSLILFVFWLELHLLYLICKRSMMNQSRLTQHSNFAAVYADDFHFDGIH